MRTPIIFVVFNRPDLTVRVFEHIRAARPAELLVISDGPREGIADEAGKVAEVRMLIERGVDWPCQVHRDYAEKNMGCRHRVASGLTWAFSKVEEAIILEDDCLPEPTFFPFCEELLARYRDDPRIMHVAGTNLAAPYLKTRTSYWFSHQPAIWGWATWRRAWQLYDVEMRAWEERQPAFRASFASRWEAQYWTPLADEARRLGVKASTWDFAWMFACRSLGGLCVMPRTNLIQNIGFGASGTHASDFNERHHLPSHPLEKVSHPPAIAWNRFADEMVTRAYAGEPIDLKANLLSRLRIWRDSRRVGQ